MDDLTQQIDEISALVAIYGNDWHTEDIDNKSYSIDIPDGHDCVTLYIKLPADYPSCSPPVYQISAPHLNRAAKLRLGSLLDEVYSLFNGEPIIYQWIEKIREELQSESAPDRSAVEEDEISEETEIPIEISTVETCASQDCPVIHHGETIVDRKSSFQGHAAIVTGIDEVNQVFERLLSNRKIEQATHNIYAYRIFNEDKKTFVQDCNDDGESHAGGRLLHLLQIVDARNVLVVVTRWYGGIHLGPDRFRHINNAARQVLQQSQLITNHRDKK